MQRVAILVTLSGTAAAQVVRVSGSGDPRVDGAYTPYPLTASEAVPSLLSKPVWAHADEATFLYHYEGRWIVGDDFRRDGAFAFARSYAPTPCALNCWSTYSDGEWRDRNISLACASRAAATCASPLGFYELSNGVLMPKLGLGTAGLNNDEEVLAWALEGGYPLVDTACEQHPAYANERLVGRALGTHPFFVTTKLSPAAHGIDATRRAFREHLRNLRTDVIDLFLIHHPGCLNEDGCEGSWLDSYAALERLYEEGYARAIGLSNFDRALLGEAVAAARVRPHVLQNYMDPFHQDRAARDSCRALNITYTAYSALGRQYTAKYRDGVLVNEGANPVLADPTILAIAAKHNASAAAVVLRWALQSGVAVIPQSSQRKHVLANLADPGTFLLDAGDMARVDALDATVL